MQDEKQIINKFKIAKKRQIIVAAPLLLAILTLITLKENPEFQGVFGLSRSILYIASFAVLAIGIVFSLKNWRCPACNVYLRKNLNPQFCPKCGAKLQEN